MSLSILESAAAREGAAIRRSQAVIEFAMDGRILHANENFLAVVGYRLEEVVGKHHSLFIEPRYAGSEEYRLFWSRLGRGEAIEAEFLRLAKGGAQIWLRAVYTPIMGRTGKPEKVIKFATDVTARKSQIANFEGQIAAIRKSQAVIEFDLSGTVLDANENFLAALGYRHDPALRLCPDLDADPRRTGRRRGTASPERRCRFDGDRQGLQPQCS